MTAAAHTEPLRDPALDEAAPYRLAIPNLAGWLSANDPRAGRLYFKRSHTIAAWRDAGRAHAVKGRLPRIDQVRIIAECCFRDRRHRDPGNYYDTAKAAVDGLVDAGVLVDDSAPYVLGPDMRLGPVLPPRSVGGLDRLGLLVLHLYPIGEEAGDA